MLKFFRDEDKLDKLRAGCFYCNTPEFYRLSTLPGVSDRNESALYTYRRGREDKPIELRINEIDASDVQAFTLQRGDDSDSYLHCWTLLEIPRTEKHLKSLKADLKRLRTEFGENYAFIEFAKLRQFIELLQGISTRRIWCQEVTYSANVNFWNSICKSRHFAYQREYRFGIEGCGSYDTDPFIMNHDAGFMDLIHKNPKIVLSDSVRKITWLEIDPPNIDNDSGNRGHLEPTFPTAPQVDA